MSKKLVLFNAILALGIFLGGYGLTVSEQPAQVNSYDKYMYEHGRSYVAPGYVLRS